MLNICNSEFALRAWNDGELALLERLMGDPTMTKYLGAPESIEKIRQRHARYCLSSVTGDGPMFVITLGPGQIAAGLIGYWERDWHNQPVWETGWSVLPEFQGHGIATQATFLIAEQAKTERKHRFMHAFPSIHNEPSNAICRKTGFILLGQADLEYPPGHWMRCNDWQLDLQGNTGNAPQDGSVTIH